MTLASDYRWIIAGKLEIRKRVNGPSNSPDFSIKDLIQALMSRIAKSDVYRSNNVKSQLMWCVHLDHDNDYYKLLLQASDKNVSDVSFINFETKETRDVEKDKDEGGHYAAHVLIKKVPDDCNRHLILVEKVSRIHLSSVKHYLKWICGQGYCEKIVRDKYGNSRGFSPVIEMDGYQSQTVRNALRTGTLEDIEFISYEKNHKYGLDEKPVIDKVVHEARWEVRKSVTEDEARKTFGGIREFVRSFGSSQDNTEVFVKIKTEDGYVKRAKVHHNGDEILEQAFVQYELVDDFDKPLPQRYQTFRDDMIQKMREVAKKVGG